MSATLFRRLVKELGVDAYETHRRVLVSGAGFLCDSYDLFVISLALDMMAQNDYGVPLSSGLRTSVSVMAVVGAMFGQVFFGFMADQLGRRCTFLATCLCTILGTVLSASVVPSAAKGFNIYQQLMLWRFVLGFGVGGEYPLSSTITAEASSMQQRDKHLALVFSMQGVGRLFCAVVLTLCLYIPKTDVQWRVAILMGALPMILASYQRYRMEETEAFVALSMQQTRPENSNLTMTERVWNAIVVVKDHRWALAGTAGSWFLLDVVYYGNSLFSPQITRAMGLEHDLHGKARLNLLIQFIAMPGYICSVLFISRIGKKRLQLVGFAAMSCIFLLLSLIFSSVKARPLAMGTMVFFYALSFFFTDFGPNTTTFVIPSLIFPTDARATCHGLSAAAGKLGALWGGSFFLRIQESGCTNFQCHAASPAAEVNTGLIRVFFLCCVIAAAGFAWTWYLVDDLTHASLSKGEAQRPCSPRSATSSANCSPRNFSYVMPQPLSDGDEEDEQIWSADTSEVEPNTTVAPG